MNQGLWPDPTSLQLIAASCLRSSFAHNLWVCNLTVSTEVCFHLSLEHVHASFQASTIMQMRSALFQEIAWHRVVIL
jgi:hypothetical protein